MLLTQVNRFREQSNQLTRVMHCPTRRLRQQLPRAAQHMAQALLLGCLLEAVVRRPAIADQHATPVDAKDPLQCIGTALRVDGVAGRTRTDPGMEPGWLSP